MSLEPLQALHANLEARVRKVAMPVAQTELKNRSISA